MPNKQDARIIKTKAALKSALIQLLKEKPLDHISITEICRTARINRGTFYLHYGNVDDLFTEFFKEIMNDLRISYQEPYRHFPEFTIDKLIPDHIKIFRHVKQHEKFYQIILSKNVPLIYYYLLFDEVNLLITSNQQQDNKIEDAFHAAYHANAILGLIIHWYKTDFTLPVEYVNEQLMAIIRRRTD